MSPPPAEMAPVAPVVDRQTEPPHPLVPGRPDSLGEAASPAAHAAPGRNHVSVMTIDSVSTFLDALRYERLFDDEQLQQLSEDVLAGFDDADSLARHLVQAGWLTAYQVRHLFEGHATR